MNHRKPVIEPYNPQWPHLFSCEAAALLAQLGEHISLYHIGSTAVPGLEAKNIIDILLVAPDLTRLDNNHKLQEMGYRGRGENGIAGRRYFVKGENRRTHHIHAFACGDANIVRHLAFRDYLRANVILAEEYASVKRLAAKKCGGDMATYAALKNPFIAYHQQQALLIYNND